MFVRAALLVAAAAFIASPGLTLEAARAGGAAIAADVVPDPPTGLRVLARRGQTVTLSWTAPTAGPVIIGYVIEGGLAPGQVLGSVPTTDASTVFTFDAPIGIFHVRVHAISDHGRGDASNEILLVVSPAAALAPPSAPASLLGLAHGSTLGLSWTTTLDGGPATRVWLQVSGTLSGVLPMPAGERFTVDGVPPGTYTFTLVAENDAGPSPPSNAVTLTFPSACTGGPNPPVAFRAWQVGSTVSIAWDPPSSGPAVDRYSVHVEGDLALSFDTTERLVSAPLPPGQFAVRVEAVNACGRSTSAPAAPAWTAVTRDALAHTVHFAARPATSYRVFWSASRADLDPLAPGLPFFDTDVSPVRLPLDAPASPRYYRVFTIDGPFVTGGGRITTAPAFDVTDHTGWPGNITPALWDIDGDGCLDLIGGRGHCDGTFQTYPLASTGLGGLASPGRNNRDSRFADYTGDGVTDVFTNVYSRADEPSTSLLHIGGPAGTFAEDPAVTALAVRGFGETVLAADFDNDGDVDLFVPHYTHLDDGGRNALLINDGAGHFTDIAESAGVAVNAHAPPEAAQALDFDGNGTVDIHVASQLFLNNGDLTFTNAAAQYNLPVRFDEGMRLFDVDLDGDLDLVHHDSTVTRLHVNNGSTFDAGQELHGSNGLTFGYGLNLCDINADGFEDVVIARNWRNDDTVGQPLVLVNAGGALHPTLIDGGPDVYNDLLACADITADGGPDIVGRWSEAAPVNPAGRLTGIRSYVNRSGDTEAIRLRIVDSVGRKNQQGRLVRLTPRTLTDVTLVRVVESGSGYMAQNGYDLLVAAPWPGTYEIEVRYAGGWVRTTARPGDVLTIRADGTVTAGLQ